MEDKSIDTNRSVRPKRSRRQTKQKLIIIVIIAVVIYLVVAVISIIRGSLSTTTALSGVLTEDFRADGYVFRDQTVINSPCDGHLECMVSDGDRVSEGQIIGYIYSQRPDGETLKQIKALYKRLIASGISGETTTYSSSGDSGKESVASAIRDMSDLRADRNLTYFAEQKEVISELIKDDSDNAQSVKTAGELNAEIDSLNSGAGILQTVKAETGGIFCPRTDGLEDRFEYSKTKDLTPSYLDELDGILPTVSQTVTGGQPLCKIINNYTWCFAANTNKEIADTLKEGQSVKLEFFDLDDNIVPGKISRISQEENGKVTVVVSTNRYVKGIYSVNRINCDIVTVNVEGIKLPVGCLRVKDGVEGVFVVRLDRAKFVPVTVNYKNSEWAIVTPIDDVGNTKLKIYDEVIVDAKSVEDDKIIR